MLAELAFGVVAWIVILLFVIVVGDELFGIMVNEHLRYLRLTIHNAPHHPEGEPPSKPEPVARCVSWARGEMRDLAGCVYIRHTGRIRYGTTGRWMNMRGEAFFSLAAPAFVWRATITYLPGIRLEVFDYYADREAGMKLNLFSVLPLGSAHTNELKESPLFRYFGFTPLFPMIYCSSDFIRWENVDDTMTKAIIHDKDHSVEALVRFGGRGVIESIESGYTFYPATGRSVPGHFTSRFSDYAGEGDYRIPMQVTSEIILPTGEQCRAEYVITGIEFDAAGISPWRKL